MISAEFLNKELEEVIRILKNINEQLVKIDDDVTKITQAKAAIRKAKKTEEQD